MASYPYPNLQYAMYEYVYGKPLVTKNIAKFLKNETEENYNLSVIALNASTELATNFAKEGDYLTARILASLPDGTVWYDSSKGDQNTFANFKADIIHPNATTRSSVRMAMDTPEGYEYEYKFSNTTYRNEYYYAVRAGSTPSAIGFVIRLSIS